jgi:hypothetical protein
MLWSYWLQHYCQPLTLLSPLLSLPPVSCHQFHCCYLCRCHFFCCHSCCHHICLCYFCCSTAVVDATTFAAASTDRHHPWLYCCYISICGFFCHHHHFCPCYLCCCHRNANVNANATIFAIATTDRCLHYLWSQPNMSKDKRIELGEKLDNVEDSPSKFDTVTNIFFPKFLKHRTTWMSPKRKETA